jgi:hypothetical protein
MPENSVARAYRRELFGSGRRTSWLLAFVSASC